MLFLTKLLSGRRSAPLLLVASCLSLWAALSYNRHSLLDPVAAGPGVREGGDGGGGRSSILDATLVGLCFCISGAAASGLLLVALRKMSGPTRSCRTDPQPTSRDDGGGGRGGTGLGPPAFVAAAPPLLALCHAAATLSESVPLLLSGGLEAASLEPPLAAALTSALLACGGAGCAPLHPAVLVALPLVSLGAATLRAAPGAAGPCGGGACTAALVVVAALLRVVRNVGLKAAYDAVAADCGGGGNAAAAKAALLLKVNTYASLWLLLPTAALCALRQTAGVGVDVSVVATAACLHAAGALLSLYVLLQRMTVVGHAVCRLVKNAIVFIACAMAAVDDEWPPSSVSAVGGALLVVGVVVYVASPRVDEARGGTAWKERLQAPLFTLLAVCLVLFSSLGSAAAPRAAPDRAAAASPLEPQRHFMLRNASHELVDVAPRQPDAEPAGDSSPPRGGPPRPDPFVDPLAASLASNELRSVDAVAEEAHRLHALIFGRLLGGYRRAVLVNLFTWANKGDHLITIGELKVLERFNVTIIHACYYPATRCQFERVPRAADVVVLLQGGGYAAHPAHQGAFDSVVRSFPEQRVILLPGSTCYPVPPCTALDALARALRNHSDFHVLLRDAYSYETVRGAVASAGGAGGVHLYLVPDIAWAVSSLLVDVEPVYDIVWLKRNDWETADAAGAAPPAPAGVSMQVTDWSDSWMGQSEANYWERLQLRTLSGVAFLARGRVVISDRLHAHLMCQLMRKPNVLVNSRTRKQEHYYVTWEKSVESSRLASNNSEALAMALELLRSRGGGPAAVPFANPV